MPSENINLSNEIFFDFWIDFFKLSTDNLPQPSIFDILSKSKLNISCGSFMRPISQKFWTIFFPKPSMLSASFETKCFIFSIEIFSHLKPSLAHLLTASCFLV